MSGVQQIIVTSEEEGMRLIAGFLSIFRIFLFHVCNGLSAKAKCGLTRDA